MTSIDVFVKSCVIMYSNVHIIKGLAKVLVQFRIECCMLLLNPFIYVMYTVYVNVSRLYIAKLS